MHDAEIDYLIQAMECRIMTMLKTRSGTRSRCGCSDFCI